MDGSSKDTLSMIKDMVKDNKLIQMELKLRANMKMAIFQKAKLFGMMVALMLEILRTASHMVKEYNIIQMEQFLHKENGRMDNTKIIHRFLQKKVNLEQQEISLQNRPEVK